MPPPLSGTRAAVGGGCRRMTDATLDTLIVALLLLAAISIGAAVGYHAGTLHALDQQRVECGNRVPGR